MADDKIQTTGTGVTRRDGINKGLPTTNPKTPMPAVKPPKDSGENTPKN